MSSPSSTSLPALAVGAAAAITVLYAGLCKALLFYMLDYVGSDLSSFLEMSWSWYYAGLPLHDNVYGHHYAIHGFYLLLAFSPLTIPLGGYGFILGLVALGLLAVWRVSMTASLDLRGRLAVLAGLLCPVAYFAFDNPYWGFHPELCYPPLALVLAVDLLDGRPGRAILAGLLVALVKEDGAVLCAAVLLAYFASRLWMARGSREERRRLLATAFLSLLAVTLVFAAGMAALGAASRALASTQATSTARVVDSLQTLALTLTGHGRPFRRIALQEGLRTYVLTGVLVLLPLGRRVVRGLVLLLLSSPPLVIVLMISSAASKFGLTSWAPRLATLLALILACLAFASSTAWSAPPSAATRAGPARASAAALALVAVSFALQLHLLARVDYSPFPRLQAWALLSRRDDGNAKVSKPEVRLLRCVAGRLPGGLPMSTYDWARPVFHRQSIVFEEFEARAWHPPRLRVVRPSEAPSPRAETPCDGPRVEDIAVQVECALLPLVADCGGAGGAATKR